MKDIGILYICTGKYHIFWKEFYKSAEKYFLPGHFKRFFVFTDAEVIYGENNNNVTKVHQSKLQFPLDSLMRFDMFLTVEHKLLAMSHIYFFNANIIFLKDILPAEIFPTDDENGLIGYQHAAFYDKPPVDFIFERNPISKAYVAAGRGSYYYQGCVIGGRTHDFLQMAKVLNENIKNDLKNNFIAIWWDESHINHYLLNKKVKLLHPGYAYPELWDLPFEKKAVMLDKTTRMNIDVLRGIRKATLIEKFKYVFKGLFKITRL